MKFYYSSLRFNQIATKELVRKSGIECEIVDVSEHRDRRVEIYTRIKRYNLPVLFLGDEIHHSVTDNKFIKITQS